MPKYRSARELRLTIAALMGVHGERQEDLAQGLGLTQGSVSLKLSGRSRITLDDVDAIAEHYGITPGQLLTGVEAAVTNSLKARPKGGPVAATDD